MAELTSKSIYDKFSKWSPEHAAKIKEYRPWSSTSIVVWLENGMMYKIKYIADNKFIMQTVTKEDIDNKFNLIKGEERK